MAKDATAYYYGGPAICVVASTFIHWFAMKLTAWLAMCLIPFCFAVMAFEHALGADGVDTSPLPIQTVRAFPNLKPRRPVAITHAGDGTNRLFFLSEYGQILVIPNNQKASETKTFLDIEYKVDYEDKENEEGLLGLAFHPKYEQNGEFF